MPRKEIRKIPIQKRARGASLREKAWFNNINCVDSILK